MEAPGPVRVDLCNVLRCDGRFAKGRIGRCCSAEGRAEGRRVHPNRERELPDRLLPCQGGLGATKAGTRSGVGGWHGSRLRDHACPSPGETNRSSGSPRTLNFDLDQVVVLPVVHPRALPCRQRVPLALRAKILFPERPRAALQRSDGIDRTHRLAILAFQENAIAVGPLRETVVQPDAAEMCRLQPPVASTQECRNSGDFVLGSPDVTGVAAATVPALRTGELQPVPIPLVRRHRERSRPVEHFVVRIPTSDYSI